MEVFLLVEYVKDEYRHETVRIYGSMESAALGATNWGNNIWGHFDEELKIVKYTLGEAFIDYYKPLAVFCCEADVRRFFQAGGVKNG